MVTVTVTAVVDAAPFNKDVTCTPDTCKGGRREALFPKSWVMRPRFFPWSLAWNFTPDSLSVFFFLYKMGLLACFAIRFAFKFHRHVKLPPANNARGTPAAARQRPQASRAGVSAIS